MSIFRIIKQIFKRIRKWLKKLTRPVLINIKVKLGIPVKFHSPAREVLENTILPYYASLEGVSRVLFVGTDWYTIHYRKFFKQKIDYWTIDPDPEQARYGAKNHIVDYVENLEKYFESGFFDIIFCNGVLGFGLNQKDPADRSFDSCHTCLCKGGILVIGRDDTSDFLSFSLDELNSMQKFKPHYFPPLATKNYSLKPQFEYLYSFYSK